MTVSPHIAFASADDPAAREDWAVLLNACPTARVHADPRWLEVVSRAFRAPGVFALARDPSGVVSAGVAGYYSRTLRGARVFHSLRHGVLTREPALLRPVMAAVEAECRSRGCAQAVLGGAPEGLPGPYRASTQTTLTLDLKGGSESLWNGFGNKVRNTIRKAERDGLEVSRDLAYLSTFPCNLRSRHDRTSGQRAGAVVLSRHLRRLQRRCSAVQRGRGRPELRSDGRRLCWRLCGLPIWSVRRSGPPRGANTLLLWHVARDLAGEGVCSLDLGPSKPNSGAFRFKLHLGGVPQTLHYVDLLRPAQSVPASAASAGQPPTPGPLDRTIEHLPFPLRVQVRTWLGRTGRLL